jgi:hypothetical protein
MATRRPGALVGRGNTSDIVEWGAGRVAKVLHHGIPAEWAGIEASTIRLVRAAGLPAPEVHDVVTVGARPGIVMERVTGPSLWELMLAAPAQVPSLTATLVGLQARLVRTPAPDGLSSVVSRLRRQVRRAPMLAPAERSGIARAVADLPDGSALCHFDLHPDNVLLGDSGPVVVDWFDAAAGEPAADLARSCVLMDPATAVGRLRQAPPDVLDRVSREYRGRVVDALGVRPEELDRWRRPLLAARLTEPLPGHVRRATLRALRAPASGTDGADAGRPLTHG